MKGDDISSISQSILACNPKWGDGHDGAIGNHVAATTSPCFGRDSERLVLIEAYQRLLETQESQLVFVHGTSGQGKTSLVDTLREHVVDSSGFFCAGKFFQDSEIQEPFSAITAAFSDLCDLVSQSPDFDDQTRDRIRDSLALDGHLLAQFVNLTLFLSRDSMNMYSISRCEKEIATFARFRAACKAFLLVMASEKHPVVLFVDDLQWLDNSSAKLIEMFIIDTDLKNVMFIFSYRDEEASAVADIVQSAEKKRQVIDIHLSNLGLEGVRQILAWELDSMTDNIDALGELTFQRTAGNPFFVSLFLEAICTEEFLSTNEAHPTFDVDIIRSSIMVADSIAELLSQKVYHLTSGVRRVLTVASLIGYSFDEEVLVEVPSIIQGACTDKETRDKIISLLKLAADEGFIERVRGGTSYHFSHDKVQRSFQDLIDKSETERLHLLIGKTFLCQNSEGSIYNAAVHMNVAPEFLDCKEQWIVLARINLDASHYCQRISAFDQALFFSRKGTGLLDEIKMMWSTEVFELSLELTESVARMALLVGDFATCNAAVRDVMLHVHTKEQQVNILLINVECRMAQNEMKASIRASTEALSVLGVRLPRKATRRHVIFKIAKLNFLIAGKTDDDILGLPPVEDESWAVAIRLLMHICFYSTMLTNDEATAVYAALLAMELTLKHGMSTHAAPALSIFGVVILRIGNIERAYALGKLSLKLMEQWPSREGDCSTLGFANTLLLHWKEPVRSLQGPLVDAADAGLGRGDVIYSTYCVSRAVGMAMCSGVHLEEVERYLLSQHDQMHEFGQSELICWFSPFMQCVANLRSSSTDWVQLSRLSGDFMNPTEPSSEAASNNVAVTAATLSSKLWLANSFGFYDVARETLQALKPFEFILQRLYSCYVFCWNAGVAHYEGFIADGNRKHLRKARKYKKLLQQRDSLGPNAAAFLKHLNFKEAILLRIRKRRSRRTDTDYDSATLHLLDRELDNFSIADNSCTPCFVVARAYLNAGFVAERMGRFGKALRYFELAQSTFQDWGAFAPAVWVEEKCEALRRTQRQEATPFNIQDLLVGGMVQFGEDVE